MNNTHHACNLVFVLACKQTSMQLNVTVMQTSFFYDYMQQYRIQIILLDQMKLKKTVA